MKKHSDLNSIYLGDKANYKVNHVLPKFMPVMMTVPVTIDKINSLST